MTLTKFIDNTNKTGRLHYEKIVKNIKVGFILNIKLSHF